MGERLLVTVDSLDEGKASLLLRLNDGEVPLGIVPVSVLPKGVAAGDILSLSFCAEPERTAEARSRANALHERLMRR